MVDGTWKSAGDQARLFAISHFPSTIYHFSLTFHASQGPHGPAPSPTP